MKRAFSSIKSWSALVWIAAWLIVPAAAGLAQNAGGACCSIVSVDSGTGIVTASVNRTSQTFTFKLANRGALISIRVSQPVFANFKTGQVSLDGRAIAGTIISIAPVQATHMAAPSPASSPSSGGAGATSGHGTANGKPAVTAKSGGASGMVVDTSKVGASEGTTATAIRGATAAPHPPAGFLAGDVKIRGVYSPPSENPHGEPDPIPIYPVQHKFPVTAAGNLAYSRRLLSTEDGKHALQSAVQRLGGLRIRLSLLAGHTYMVNDCLGVKASAGDFQILIPPPDLQFTHTGATLTFTVSSVSLSAFKVRLRPDASDLLQPCHFSGQIGVGGEADNVRYELTFDPIYDLQKCKLTSMRQINTQWKIGSLHLDPLPGQITVVAKDMVADAMNYFGPFAIEDQLGAYINDFLGSAVCGKVK